MTRRHGPPQGRPYDTGAPASASSCLRAFVVRAFLFRPPPCRAANPYLELAMTDRVLILDFGSQVTQLIARRVRESGVYCEIHPFNVDAAKIRGFGAKAVILSGGPASV